MSNTKTAIILFNLGGPDKEGSIKPFLFNLFNDKAIISLPQPFRFLLAKFISSKREKTAKEIYGHIGGKSPILEITQSQADEIEKELSYIGDFKAFVAMRYWKPFARDAVAKLKEYDPDQIILLPLYPQFSTTTSGSSINEFVKELTLGGINVGQQKTKKIFGIFNKKISFANQEEIPLKTICCYPDENDFILSHAKLLKQKIIESNLKIDDFRILFSAHGLPQKIVDGGDPYVFQIELSAQKIMSKLEDILRKDNIFEGDFAKKLDSKVCFQSKVGPLKWTSPSLDHEIKRVALDGKNPIIVPIAFVSEHSETLVELDIEYEEMAQKLGIKKYIRVQALNIDGHFIRSLVNICRKAAISQESGFLASGEPKRICPKTFKGCMSSRA